jgi:hypothetical protein
MKKNKLTKLALMGLATGAMITSTVTLSANTVTETKGTYLAGGCGGGGKCGGGNRSNPGNYTTDNFTPTSNNVVNPNMTPKPEAMQNGTINTQGQTGVQSQNHGSCGGGQKANGQIQQSAPSHGSCGGGSSSNGQGSCAGKSTYNR